MNTVLAEPEQFLRDLNRVSATLDPSLKIKSFLSDLDRVHRDVGAVGELVHPVSDHDLAGLARRFEEIRKGAIKRLGGSKWLERVPENDPLRCQVGLFGTLDWGLRETAHTRALAWFMDPEENHGFKDTLLRAFMKEVFGLDNDPKLSSDVNIISESLNDESRDRLDLCINGEWTLPRGKVETWLVIVEAKIDAEEGEDQCKRYERQCRRKIDHSDNPKLVFLTPNGKAPKTEYRREWVRLSFIRLMALFQQQLPKLIGKPGFEFLRLYMTGVLKDLYLLNCGNFSKKMPDTNEIYRICEYLSLETTGGK